MANNAGEHPAFSLWNVQINGLACPSMSAAASTSIRLVSPNIGQYGSSIRFRFLKPRVGGQPLRIQTLVWAELAKAEASQAPRIKV